MYRRRVEAETARVPGRNLFIRIASGLYHLSRSDVRVKSRDVGSVLAVTTAGQLTVRGSGSEVVPEGTLVRDASGKLHGQVVRVFGPVSRPYLTVRPRRTPSVSEGAALLGATLVRE